MALSLNELRDPMTVLKWVQHQLEEIDPDEDADWIISQTIDQALELCDQIPPDPDPEVVRLNGILRRIATLEMVQAPWGLGLHNAEAETLRGLVAEFAPEKQPA